jgi:hypothetical protein
MLPADAVADLGTTLTDLQVDPAVVEATTAALNAAFEALAEGHFATYGEIGQSSFGDSEAGTGLAYHHSRAHQVMVDTIEGTKQDIVKLTENFKLAVTLMENTDMSTNAELVKTQALVDGLNFLDKHSYGDSANDASRNDPTRYEGGA